MSRRRVTRLARGSRKLGQEPDEPGKTDPHPRCAATTPGAALPAAAGTSQEGYLRRQRDPLPTRVGGLPPLPPAFHETLDAGLDDLGLDLRPEQREALEAHVRLLIAWNQAINLTAIRDPAEIARLHVLDSLSAVAVLRPRGAGRLLDLGSGGGFPGVPLAVALDAEALLVDGTGKKVAFLQAVSDAIPAARLAARHARAEALADGTDREAWPVVTARAVASLAELVELAVPLLAPGGVLIAWKRGSLDDELPAARRALEAVGGGRVDTVAAGTDLLEGHRLVLVEKLAATPPGWPRDPAARRRRPW